MFRAVAAATGRAAGRRLVRDRRRVEAPGSGRRDAPLLRKSDGKTELLVPGVAGDREVRIVQEFWSGEVASEECSPMIRKLIFRRIYSLAHGLVFAAWSAAAVPVFKENPAIEKEEAEYYQIVTFAIPPGIVLEAGALEWLPDGRLAVSTRRGEIYLVANPEADDLAAVEVHPVRPRPARGARPGLPRRLALRHPARRAVADQGQRWRRQGRRVRDGQRRLGDQRRLPRVCLRLEVRPRRLPLGRALPHRLVHQREQVPGLGPADQSRGQDDPDLQRASARPAASA